MNWQFWLIDGPARLTEILFKAYRLYMLVVLSFAAVSTMSMLVIVLGLWFGFGIRWGW